MKHECVDHLRSYVSRNGEQRYSCQKCYATYSSAAVDQMHDDALTADLYDEDPEFWEGMGLKRPAKKRAAIPVER